MSILFLLLGLLTIFISTYLFRDWASGLAGFIYVGIDYLIIILRTIPVLIKRFKFNLKGDTL